MQNLRALTGMLWFDSGGFAVGRRIAIRRPWAKGHAGRRRDSPEQSSAAASSPEQVIRGYRVRFGLRLGAKERARHA